MAGKAGSSAGRDPADGRWWEMVHRASTWGLPLVASLLGGSAWGQVPTSTVAPPDEASWTDRFSAEVQGFVEAAASTRFLTDPLATADFLLAESRARLDGALRMAADRTAPSPGAVRAGARVQVDLVGDAVAERVDIDLRRAWAEFSVGPLTVRGGRQILTWGTGRYLFLNDLFPKDLQSFFIGRDETFLFAPSDSLKISLVGGPLGFDLVWNPVFAPDRSLTGERLTFFWAPVQTRIGPVTPGAPIRALPPDKELENGEWALRLRAEAGGWELATYGYIGFFGAPTESVFGLAATHARLGAYGASARGPVLGGTLSMEGVFRHSWDDVDGDQPTVPNSQVRGLLGFERSWARPALTLGVQYYFELLMDHARLLGASPAPDLEPDELRHVLTLGLTYRPHPRLTLDLFAFVSPSDVDAHLRPRIEVKILDPVAFVVGANVFFGRDPFTPYAQLDASTHGYSRLRFTF